MNQLIPARTTPTYSALPVRIRQHKANHVGKFRYFKTAIRAEAPAIISRFQLVFIVYGLQGMPTVNRTITTATRSVFTECTDRLPNFPG
jgi:hypothetical protein